MVHAPPNTHNNKLNRIFGHKTRFSSGCNNNCDFEVNREQPGGELQDRCEEIPECYSWRQETYRRFPEPGRDDGYIVGFLVGTGETIGQRCNTEY